MDLRSGLLIGRIRGIAIRVHWSWLFVFALVTWNLERGVLPFLVPGWSPGERWLGGFAAAGVFFVSVLLHELSHAFVALHYGMRVPSITLFIFGGVSSIEGEMQTPGQEFRIAVAGPAMSILIGFVLGAIGFLLGLLISEAAQDFSRILIALGGVNLTLGIFNLIPGFPLDGGRVLRSIVWAMSGDLTKSTRIAALSGTVLSWSMIAGGLYLSFFTGNFYGLWYVLIGLFLKSSSDNEYGQMVIEKSMQGVLVRDVMREAPEPVDPASNLSRIVDERVIGRGERALFVGGAEGVVGLFTVADLARVPNDRLPSTTARDIMVPVDQIVTARPQMPLLDAIRLMTEHDYHQLPVVEDGRMVGVLTRGDVLHQLELRQQFGR